MTAFRVEHRPEGVSAWTEATATPIEDGPFHYAGKLYLKGLEGATVYEARVMTRNEEGWNKHKNVFSFATRGAGGIDVFMCWDVTAWEYIVL